jgi:hypothetical protein
MRERRPRRGELVQIGSSFHAWLENHAEEARLLLFIDDATSEILAAEFVGHEPMDVWSAPINLCLIPWSKNCDWRGTMTINTPMLTWQT